MNKSPQVKPHLVITIGRSFGAGGREAGIELANRLGIKYYDKELLKEAANRAGLDAGLFEKNDERAPGILAGLLPISMSYNVMSWYGGGGGAFGGEAVYRAQSEFIREIALNESCVIVGRTADYILRDFPGLVSVFLHATEDECIDRIMRRSDCSNISQARQILRRTNRLRADFYNFYTGRTWGCADTYDITLDSSKISIKAIADIIIAYIRAREEG